MMNTQQSTKPMNNLNFSPTEVTIFSILFFVMGGLISFLLFIYLIVNPLKGEAVEKGYAEWKVVDNNTGETKFVWK